MAVPVDEPGTVNVIDDDDPGGGVDWAGEFSRETRDGRPVTVEERLDVLRRFAESGRLLTTEPLLPALFTLRGKTYSIEGHFPFSPMYRTHLPRRTVLKTGRQVAKSSSLATAGLTFAASVPYTTILFLTPLFEQIRRFSTNYVGDFIMNSPLRGLFMQAGAGHSVLQRTLPNASKLVFSFATTNADRTRGLPIDMLNFDELQDAHIDILSVLEETLSHSKWKYERFSGTPKSMDGSVEVTWQSSSQAEWVIPCHHCTDGGHATDNVPASEYHLQEMIGPHREDISEERPGLICWKCREPVRPRLGRWRHRYPDRRWDFAGYHIPQVIMPFHYANPAAWAILLTKRDNMAPNEFHNENLGESYDSGSKLVTQTDIKAAATLPWTNPRKFDLDAVDPQVTRRLDGYYSYLAMGVDWGGGRRVLGKAEVSFTKLALVGLKADGRLDLLWGAQLFTPHDHEREAFQVLAALQQFRCNVLAHDFTGAGIMRETFMIQAGLELEFLMPIESARLLGHAPVEYIGPDRAVARPYWRMDKARTLLITTTALKRRLLTTFAYDHVSKDQPGLLHDFLAMFDEHSGASAGEIYTIKRIAGKSDDFAQAVNLACVACWNNKGAWPNFADDLGYAKLTRQQMGRAVGEDGDGAPSDSFFRIP